MFCLRSDVFWLGPDAICHTSVSQGGTCDVFLCVWHDQKAIWHESEPKCPAQQFVLGCVSFVFDVFCFLLACVFLFVNFRDG